MSLKFGEKNPQAFWTFTYLQFQFHLVDLLTGLIQTLQFLLHTEPNTAGHSWLM